MVTSIQIITFRAGPLFPENALVVSVPESNIPGSVFPVKQVLYGLRHIRIAAPENAFASRLRAKGQFVVSGDVLVRCEDGAVTQHKAAFTLRYVVHGIYTYAYVYIAIHIRTEL